MKKLVTEQQVKEALNIDSFRNLTKEKVVKFASLIPNMDKEVAKAVINQFPQYVELSRTVVEALEQCCNNTLDNNNLSNREAIESYKIILESLNNMLKDDDLSFEEKQIITDKMIQVADKISLKDSENKRFLSQINYRQLGVLSGVLLLGAGILGYVMTNGDSDIDIPHID